MSWTVVKAAVILLALWFVYDYGGDVREAKITATVLAEKNEALSQALEENKRLSNDFSAVDSKYQTLVKAYQNETSRLSADLANGSKRLLVNGAKCPDSGTSSGTGMDHGEKPQLDRAAESAYLALFDGIRRKEAQLEACQDILAAERK